MNITQAFYDQLAPQYDKLFLNWQSATREQAAMLDKIFCDYGFDKSHSLLDCACGIGTQAIGLAGLGYSVTASDISPGALAQAKKRAEENSVSIRFAQADFCALEKTFSSPFHIVIAMDNALPHMLSRSALQSALGSMVSILSPGGLLVASIRDYDSLLEKKPPYSPPYIHKTDKGQKVSFQTWQWEGEHYKLIQYIIEDEGLLQVSKFACEYRATRRAEITGILKDCGCRRVDWLFPEETGFYQPIVAAIK